MHKKAEKNILLGRGRELKWGREKKHFFFPILCVCVYIYIYIYIHIHTHIHTHTHTYICVECM